MSNKLALLILCLVTALAAILSQIPAAIGADVQAPESSSRSVSLAPASLDPGIAPAGVANVPVNTGFQWGAISNANFYNISLADNPAFQNAAEATTSSTIWAPGQALQNNTTYFWRVRGAIGTINSNWTYSTFTTRSSTGQYAPVYDGSSIAPAGVYDVPVNTGFQWSAVSNAGSYEIQLTDNTNFLNAQDAKTNLTIWSPGQNLKPNSTYFWRVRAFAGDIAGAWAYFTFTTGNQTAASPQASASAAPAATVQPTVTP